MVEIIYIDDDIQITDLVKQYLEMNGSISIKNDTQRATVIITLKNN